MSAATLILNYLKCYHFGRPVEFAHTFGLDGGQGDWLLGGGIHIVENVNLGLQSVEFVQNRSPAHGASLFAQQRAIRVSLSDVRLHLYRDNGIHSSAYPQITLVELDYVEISGIRFAQEGLPSFPIYVSGDTLVVQDLVAESLELIHGGFRFGARRVLRAQDMVLRNCVGEGACGFIIRRVGEAPQSVLIRNVFIDSVTVISDFNGPAEAPVFWITAGDSVFVDSLEVRNCFSETSQLVSMTSTGIGTAKNILLEENTVGAPPGPDMDCPFENSGGQLVFSLGFGFENVVIQNNTSNIYPCEENGDVDAAKGAGLALRASVQGRPGLDAWQFRDILIRNHTVNDHDDYSVLDLNRIANLGRMLSIRVDEYGQVNRAIIQNVQILDCRQDNPVPEEWGSDPGFEPRMIGSSMQIFVPPGPTEPYHAEVLVEDVLIQNCDDGGFEYGRAGTLTLRNLRVVDVGRMGALIRVDTLDASNVFIKGVESWEANLSYPFALSSLPHQVVFGFQDIRSANVRNITLTNNATQFLFWTNGPFYPQLSARNLLLHQNQCEYFVHPEHSASQFPPPLISYSFLNEEYPGEGNIHGDEPGYDPTLGAPWLSEQSLCVDAGNPVETDNDMEDAEHPGFALWPSLGGLRNDIGFTGGPGAFGLDSTWVGIPQEDEGLVSVRPTAIRVDPVFPNPFNSQLSLPIEVQSEREIHVSLFDMLGRRVADIAHQKLRPGHHVIQYHADGLASGLYFLRLQSGETTHTQKVLLIR